MKKKILIGMAAAMMLGSPYQAEYVTAYSGLNVREEANEESSSLYILPFGTEVDVEKTSNDEWLKIDKGYVSADYISKDDPLDKMELLGSWHITAYAETGYPCANGNYPSVDYTIACNSLPFGTKVYIEGVGVRVVEDRGPTWLGDSWCDLYLGDYWSCVTWGSQTRKVYLFNEEEDTNEN